MELKKYRKLIGPLIVVVYAIFRVAGVEPAIGEEETIAQITQLFDALVPFIGLALVYVLPNDV